MEECLICREELPLEKLCADVPNCAGLLINGCKHFYCIDCVKSLPENQRKCSLCDLKMQTVVFHQCRECVWSLMVEAGGAGRIILTSIDEPFSVEETLDIINGKIRRDNIHKECLKAEVNKLPCFTKSSIRLDKKIACWLDYNNAKWYPLFEDQTNIETDPFICTSKELVYNNGAKINIIVVAQWEDSKEDLYYGMKMKNFIGRTGRIIIPLTPNKTIQCKSIDDEDVGVANGRLITACEEFVERMIASNGW